MFDDENEGKKTCSRIYPAKRFVILQEEKRFHVYLVLTSTFSILKEDKPFEKKIADRAWDMTLVWTMVGYQM